MAEMLGLRVEPASWGCHCDKANHLLQQAEGHGRQNLCSSSSACARRFSPKLRRCCALYTESLAAPVGGSGTIARPPTPLSTAGVEGTAGVPIVDSTTVYGVAQGDTLWSIARQHGATIEELMHLNYIRDPNELRADTPLVIPLPLPPLPSGTPWSSSPDVAREGSEEGYLAKEEIQAVGPSPRSSVQMESYTLMEGVPFLRGGGAAPSLGLTAACALGGFVILLAFRVAFSRIRASLRTSEERRQAQSAEFARAQAGARARLRSVIDIDRSFQPVPLEQPAMEGNGKQGVARGATAGAASSPAMANAGSPPNDGDPDAEPDEAWRALQQEHAEIIQYYEAGMEKSYKKFLQDSGAQAAGRFRGGMPSKFKEKLQ